MGTETLVFILFAAMLIIVFLGVPIAYALLFVGFIGLWVLSSLSFSLEAFRTYPYTILASYTFAVAPLFILMGEFAFQMGAAAGAFEAARDWLGRLRGGVLMAMIGAGALFGACSGSTIAGAAVLSKLAFPETQRYGYDKGISTGCIAIAGTLATLIPPSIMMVIYGIFTGNSIGKLLIAGVIPGVLMSIVLMANVYILARVYPKKIPGVAVGEISWSQRFRSLVKVLPILTIFVLVIGGMYAGIFTPTQAGAIGAAGAFILLLAIRRSGKLIWPSLNESIKLTVQVFLIVLAGMIFSKFVVLSGVSARLIELIGAAGLPRLAVMSLIVMLYLVLGCLIDPVSMLVITLPFTYPILTALGWDGITLGVIMIILVQIAVITPPVGFNVYVVASATGVPSTTIFQGTLPFYFSVLGVLVLVILFPEIATFLPSKM